MFVEKNVKYSSLIIEVFEIMFLILEDFSE